MAKMTPEEKARLPKGIYVNSKCDSCGKPLTGFLTYRGINNEREYCSNACFEKLEGGRGRIQPRRPGMAIEKTKKSATEEAKALPEKGKKLADKQLIPSGEETKTDPKTEDKKKKKEDPAPEPKKAKKEEEPAKKAKKEDPAPEPKKAKKKEEKKAEPKKAAKPDPTPIKKKKDKTPKVRESPYREGSSFHTAFKRLMTGKAMTLETMFEGIEAGDPGRMVSHMIRRGEETKEFKIERVGEGKVQLTKAFAPKK